MYLIDTNIFLEILLQQDKSKNCKLFLDKNIGSINISDFSLHSIGVILFKNNKENIYLKFIYDSLQKIELLSLPKNSYSELNAIKKKYNLDFDDSYQYSICKYHNLKLITMDNDFKKIKDIKIQFL